jgi:hypothetical protein
MSISEQVSNLINKIVLLKEHNSADTKRHYRFSDVINHLGYYWKESTEFILKQPHLKGTILRTYIERCSDNNLIQVNPNKIALLHDIIQEKIVENKYDLPASDELVIHLRTGDVVDCDWFLEKDYIKIIQNRIDRNNNIKKVTFCTAFHYGNNVTQGLWIYTNAKHNKNIERLTNVFTKILTHFEYLQFDIKSSTNIDSDFVYMTMASHFVKDEGGFSNLIKEIISSGQPLLR